MVFFSNWPCDTLDASGWLLILSHYKDIQTKALCNIKVKDAIMHWSCWRWRIENQLGFWWLNIRIWRLIPRVDWMPANGKKLPDWAMGTAEPILPAEKTERVIDAHHQFAKQRFDVRYIWKPTPEIQTALQRAIFGWFNEDWNLRLANQIYNNLDGYQRIWLWHGIYQFRQIENHWIRSCIIPSDASTAFSIWPVIWYKA